MQVETGHNCGDRATNEAVTAAIFERRGPKRQHATGDGCNVPLTFDEMCEE
jgi:hypothetical protein